MQDTTVRSYMPKRLACLLRLQVSGSWWLAATELILALHFVEATIHASFAHGTGATLQFICNVTHPVDSNLGCSNFGALFSKLLVILPSCSRFVPLCHFFSKLLEIFKVARKVSGFPLFFQSCWFPKLLNIALPVPSIEWYEFLFDARWCEREKW